MPRHLQKRRVKEFKIEFEINLKLIRFSIYLEW